MTRTRTLLLMTLSAAIGGCPAPAYDYDDDDDYPAAADDDDDDDDDDAAWDGDGDDDETPPPEEEDDFLSTEPRGTDAYVFVANPTRDTVSRIDAFDRTIETIDVGDEPTMVVVSSDYQRAVTFNAGSDSVSVIDVTSDDVVELPLREDFNFIAISPDGRWVVAWFNASVEDADFDVEGVRSFTEVSFVDTLAHSVQSFSVGFNPKQIKFDGPSGRAVIVSDAFLTVADLTSDPIGLTLIDLFADPIDPPTAAEVEIPPGAQWAFVRYLGSDDIDAVELATGAVAQLDGGDTPTDLDLSPDGTEVLVVSRGSQEVRLFDAVDPLGAPPVVLPTPADSIIGSLVLAAGDVGLLFTTAAPQDRITVWDRATGEMTQHRLAKPVRAVAVSPDGGSALIVHTLGDADGEGDLFTDEFAITVVDLSTWITNPVIVAGRPFSWSSSPDGRYSMFIMEGNRNVGVIDYATRLVDDVLLPSQPVHVGLLPIDGPPEDQLGWVSQEHELGRISFVAPFDLTVQTVTGFELNSEID